MTKDESSIKYASDQTRDSLDQFGKIQVYATKQKAQKPGLTPIIDEDASEWYPSNMMWQQGPLIIR